jgi:hypothetical protein
LIISKVKDILLAVRAQVGLTSFGTYPGK